MLQNAYLVAKIGADTAENEQHFAEILPIGRRVRGPQGRTSARAAATRTIASGEPAPAASTWAQCKESRPCRRMKYNERGV